MFPVWKFNFGCSYGNIGLAQPCHAAISQEGPNAPPHALDAWECRRVEVVVITSPTPF
jgi:hypothetical protein